MWRIAALLLAALMMMEVSVMAGDNPFGADDATNPFVGKFTADDVTLDVKEGDDGTLVGTVERGGQEYEFEGEVEDGKLVGSFRVGGGAFPFTVEIEGASVVFTTGSFSSTLTREAPRVPLPDELDRLVDTGDWEAASPAKNAQGLYELVHKKSGLSFVHIPGGEYEMGDDAGDSDAQPARTIKIESFLMGKTEVTQAAWDQVGGVSDDRTADGPSLPIDNITWREASTFCKRAGLRLPTEAEWEYACRAGTTTPFFFGSDETNADDYAWHHENSNGKMHPVGKKKPNAWGLHDMVGNVAEWCEDVYEYYTKAPEDGSAMKGRDGDFRVLRGGNWSVYPNRLGSAFRDRSGPDSRYGGPGMRAACSLK